MSTYHLALNPEQAHAVIKALDLCSRIGMGQLEEIEHFLAWNGVFDMNDPTTLAKRDEVRALCDAMKAVLGHPANGSHGITQEAVPRVCRVGYDVQCVLRQVIAREEHEGSHSVWHHDPLHIVSDVPLAKCEVTE